jgi:all-trans-retinol 13,14-reductase
VYNYDVIIIGSGMGGMTCGALLSKLGRKRVLILEKHFRLGGQTHEFRRRGYEWDVGLHYVGCMNEHHPMRRFMDFLTGDQVQWQRMPEDFDVFHYPDFTFRVPSRQATYRERLIELFPRESINIDRYFRDVWTAAMWIGAEMTIKAFPPLDEAPGRSIRAIQSFAGPANHSKLPFR